MSLLTLFLVLLVWGLLVGLVWWAPVIPVTVKHIITWVTAAFLLIWLLQQFGLLDTMRGVRIGTRDAAGEMVG